MLCAILGKSVTINYMKKPIIFLVHGYNGIPKIFNYFKNALEEDGYEVVIPSFPTQTDISRDDILLYLINTRIKSMKKL